MDEVTFSRKDAIGWICQMHADLGHRQPVRLAPDSGHDTRRVEGSMKNRIRNGSRSRLVHASTVKNIRGNNQFPMASQELLPLVFWLRSRCGFETVALQNGGKFSILNRLILQLLMKLAAQFFASFEAAAADLFGAESCRNG